MRPSTDILLLGDGGPVATAAADTLLGADLDLGSLERSGIPYTVLRPAPLLEALVAGLGPALERGLLVLSRESEPVLRLDVGTRMVKRAIQTETKHKEETMRQLHLALSLASALVVGFASLPEAHADTQPAAIQAQWTAHGKTYCLGNVATPAKCDVHFLRPRNVVTLLGTTWCFGEAPGVRCDVSLPRPQQPPTDGSLARWLRVFGDRLARSTGPHAMN